MKSIVYLDLFSGIGGFAKGIEQSGIKIDKHYYSEIDKHAIAVYNHNFPKSELIQDVRNVSSRTITERPDLITFGFPCQDLSIAGKGEGLEGCRSGLFFEAIRIIQELRPEVFVFENVKGLFSSNGGKDFETVLQTISDIGLYECQWQLLNTAWVLPQNRERVYFIGSLGGKSTRKIFPIRETKKLHSKTKKQGIQGKANRNLVSCITSNLRKGVHNQGETYFVTKPKDQAVSTLMVAGNSGGFHSDMTLIKKVKPVLTPLRGEKRQNGRRFKNDNEPAFTLTSQDQHGVYYDDKIRRLTPLECERLQGFPDGWTTYGNYNGVVKKMSDTQRFKQLGNAVTVPIVQLVAEKLKF